MKKQLIISIGREYGSRGHEIGEKLSKKLGLDLYDRNILDEVAIQNGANVEDLSKYDERPKHHFFSRTVRGYSNNPAVNVAELQFALLKSKAADGDSFIVIGRCSDEIFKGIAETVSIFITADHGFLYTYSPLTESDKLGKDAISGKVYEIGRRYVLAEPSAAAEHLVPVQLDGEIVGTPVKGYTPFDSTRIRVSGGGENYVHGGISLQELVVPVISFKNLRSTSKKYVEVSNAELKLLSESRKVSNLLFSLDFYQRQPVGEKIQPCTYYIYMTDDEGVVISDRQTVIADRTSTNASERVFRVRLNLKAGAYDKNKIYRLVIANDTDVPEEAEFHIDIAFADDFGFDL